MSTIEKSKEELLQELQELRKENETLKSDFQKDNTEQKKTEGIKQEEMNILQKVAGNVPGVIYQYKLRPDGSSCFPFASDAINVIYRVTPDEVREDASKVFANLHPDDIADVSASIMKSARDLTPWQEEYRVKFDDGIIRTLYGNAIPQLEADGSVLWHGFITDITEYKKAEDSLKVSEAKHSAMINNISDAIGIIGTDGFMKYKSPNIEKFIGWKPEDLIGTDGWLTVHPDDLERIQKEFFNLLAKDNSVCTVEYRYKCKDGSYKPIELTATNLINDPIICGVLMNYHDISDRKTAQELLKESELNYKSLADSGQTLVWASGTDKLCNYFNKVWLEFTGRTLEQEIGNGWTEGVHPEDFQACLETYSNAFDKREEFSMDYRLRKYTGEYRWIQDDGYPRYNSTGIFIGYIGHCQDITHRRQSERIISAFAEKYKKLLDTSRDGVHLLDINGNLIECNDSFCHMLGYPKGEVLYLNVKDWDAQIPPEKIVDILNDLIQSLSLFETAHRKKNGEIIQVEINAIGVEIDGQKYLYASARDITERKLAEKELLQTQQNYETFFNTIDEFLFVLDEQGNIIHTNSTVIERLGYSASELIGASVLAVHPPERREEAGRIVGEMLAGTAEFCLVPIVTKAGVYIPVETRVSHGFWNGKPVIFRVTKDVSQVRLSEEKFSKLFKINPSACGLSDLADHKYIEVNQAFYNLLGFTENEVIGFTAYDLGILTPETSSTIMSHANSNGYVTNVETVLKAKNGDIKHVLISSENIYVQDKHYRFTVVNDITERKLAEESLLWNKSLLQLMSSSSPLGFLVVDNRTDDILYFNQRFCQIWGIQHLSKRMENDEFKNNDIIPYCLPMLTDVPAFAESCKPLQDEENRIVVEDEIAFTNNRTIHRYSTQIRGKNDEYFGRFYIFEDITERKQIEETIKANEEYLNAVFHIIGAGVILINAENQTIIDVNKAASDLIGLPIEEIIGKVCHEFICPNEIGNCPVKDHNKSVENCERKLVCANGVHKDIIKTVYPMIYKGLNCHLESFMDISEQKLNEMELKLVNENLRETKEIIELNLFQKNALIEELFDTKERLEKINSEKDKFFSIIAHDLKSPFSGFLGLTKIMAEQISDLTMKELREFAVAMQSSANNLAKLLENLLEWSRMQGGKVDFNPVNCKISFLVKQNIDIISERAKQKNVEIINNVNNDAEVIADVPMLNSILRNLVSNAVKFTKIGGKIEIGTTIQPSEGSVVIYVKDSGIGMTEDIVGKLFRIDQKVSRPGTEGESSTGLGLLLCKEFVERHDGNIWVDSEVGKGSTFYFTLPGNLNPSS